MTEAVAALPVEALACAADAFVPTHTPVPETSETAPQKAPEACETKPEKPAVEIRISLAGSDEKELLQILSALKRHEASVAPKREEAPPPLAPANIIVAAPLVGEPLAPVQQKNRVAKKRALSPLALFALLVLGFILHTQIDLPHGRRADIANRTLVDYIVGAESSGNAAAKNPYSTALGLGQFVDATWLDLIRRHRPEIASGRNEREILEMRKDPELSRFLTSRYVEENTSILARKGLPVTPGALYLAHFAGPGGAVAILTAPESANAADVIANVDSRPGVTRDKIVNGNPFLKHFTAKDLKNWADLKMQGLTLVEGDAKSAARRDL
jgi:hypothetical protein